MKSITSASAIVIGLATSGVTVAALRGGKANQQHRALEGECVGVPDGEWRPTPGCHGAALCIGESTFFLYPCNEEEGYLYDETMGGCAPAAGVTCTVGWESIGLDVGNVGDGETGDGDSGASDASDASDADMAEAGDGEGEDQGEEEDTEGDAEGDTVANDGIEASDADTEEIVVDTVEKEKRMCNTLEEKTSFKACKKTNCVGLRDAELEVCKEDCRVKECTYEDEDEEDVEGDNN